MTDALAAVTVPRRGLAAALRANAVPLALFAALAAVPLLAHLGSERYVLALVSRAMVFAIAAVGLDLILGVGGMVSFGHAAFLGIGGYAVGILAFHGVVDAGAGLAVALGASALFALATGMVSVRTEGVYFIMITLAFGQMAFFTMTSLSAYGGDDGLTLYQRSELFGTRALDDARAFYWAVLVCLAATYVVCRVVVASRFGRVLRAARENPVRVATLGFPVKRFRLVAYVISGTLAGLAGALLANQAEFVSPAYMNWQRSGELIVMIVLGGLGSLHGAILGALAFLLMEEWLSHVTEHWKVVFGPLLVLIVLFARGGLAGLLGRIGRG